MKKLFLFVAVAAMSFSCSSDDNGGGSSSDKVQFTINGVDKTLSNVVVNEDSEDGDVYLTVTATVGQSANEIITFSTMRGDVGSAMLYGWAYTKDGVVYYDNGEMNSVVQTNSSNRLKGSFNGSLSYWDNELQQNVDVNFTDGSFDIKY